MRLSDFVVREAVIHDLKASAKEAAIREMVGGLRDAGYFKAGELEDVVGAIQRREKLGSTGIGGGIAIPHSRHNTVTRPLGLVGISRGGVAFESVDGKPVHVFILLISPPDRPDLHLRALEKASRSLRNEKFVHALREAATPDAIWALLDAADD